MQQPTGKLSGRKYRFNLGMTVFSLVLFPVLVSFGMWQLDREQQKVELQIRYDERATSPLQNETEIDWSDPDLGWIPVSAIGNFDNDRQFLLDNRILDSKVGYEVITPFTTETGTLLVNRGWVSQGLSRTEIPDITIDEEIVEIRGHIYVPDGETFVLGSDASISNEWPQLIQRIEVEQLATRLDATDIKPFVVRLMNNSQGVLETNWAAINMRPETHRAYAVQWFTMAAVLMILYIMFSFKKPEN